MVMAFPPRSVDDVDAALRAQGYLADDALATVVFLALSMGRPLLLEGEPGVGKTEVAKALAGWIGGEFIRLQCHEGIDVAQAIYEWDHAGQLLHLRAAEAAGTIGDDVDAVEAELHDERFLIRRPLLRAIADHHVVAPVLLIDEIDRADDEFEAFLLELLAEFQVTIPEMGTVKAPSRPIVILTSNRTRELHDALKRRCLYTWIGFPAPERELDIVRSRLPQVSVALADQVVAAVNRLRDMELEKLPGVAETIDWTTSLDALGAQALTEEVALDTLGAVVKDRDDLEYTAKSIQDVIS